MILNANEIWLHHDDPIGSLQPPNVLEMTHVPVTGIVQASSGFNHVVGTVETPQLSRSRST
jgi:hypothetical protein